MKIPTVEEVTTQIAPRAALASPTSTTWRVVVVAGPEVGKDIVLADVFTRRILLGSGPSCDVRLAGRLVSRRHAALEPDGDQTRIVDLGSRNGTWVGGTRVRDAYLEDGAVVGIGESSVRFETDGRRHELVASTEARFHRVVGISPEIRALHPLFQRTADVNLPVLIEGETGTGKEVLAESIHEASPRRNGPFVVFDCTTVAPALVEAELFGHERGAFTGANASREGLFEAADGGTLFIDEIGDLDVALQSKLLRALERNEVRRVGSNQWRRVDVRVLSATRRDLDKEIQAQRFRDDLFFRLAVLRIELPPLRRRQGDVAFLTHFFWRRMGGDPAALTPDIVQRFEAYDWPGNVRELHHAVARQLAIGELATLPVGAVPSPPTPVTAATESSDFLDLVVRSGEELRRARERVLGEFERRYVEHMLALHGGNVTRAASASGIGRRYFQMVRARR